MKTYVLTLSKNFPASHPNAGQATNFGIDLVGEAAETNENDIEKVNHPKHYNSHPSGIECIEIVRHYNFDVGNAIKYLWRHGLKHEEGIDDKDKAVEDLEKAIFYIKDEIKRIKDTK